MTIKADSNTIFTANRATKTRWEYEFHPELTSFEKFQAVLNFKSRSAWSYVTDNNDKLDYYHKLYAFTDAVEAGKSYMVGSDVPTKAYLKSHTSYIARDHWLYYAVKWAFQNEDQKLVVETKTKTYEIYRRGAYVEIALPHHGRGGEKHWIVCFSEPNKKVLVNVD